MRLKIGEMVSGYLYTNHNRSNIEYNLKVLILISQGEHFYFYKAIDCHGNYICIKTIRYRSEKKNVFKSPEEYIAHRRKMLLSEHRALAVPHPSLPDPLAMITLENDTSEDEKLFRKFKEWDKLKKEEPILIHEYFGSTPLTQLEDQIQLFSLEQRLNIFYKLIHFCSYLHAQGFILQSLRPEHILLKPENDDNINIVGLHYSCPLKNIENVTEYAKAYILSGHSEMINYRPDIRIDVEQLGMILCYLLTLENPFKSKEFSPNIPQIQATIDRLSSKNTFLTKLIEQLLAKKMHMRLHSLDDILLILQNPPIAEMDFQIKHVSQTKLEIKITSFPSWAKQIQLRIENNEKGTVTEKEIPFGKKITTTGKWNGEVTCSLRIINGKKTTWWKYKNVLAVAKFPIEEIVDLSVEEVGFKWSKLHNLESVSFYLEKNNQELELLACEKKQQIIFSAGKKLPYYHALKIICQPNFKLQEESLKIPQKVYLALPLASPKVYSESNQVVFEITLSNEQKKAFSQIELLHNNKTYQTENKEDFIQQRQENKVFFKLNKSNLPLFTKHKFSCRILLDVIAWKKGPEWEIDIEPPEIENLRIDEVEIGIVHITWKNYNYPHLQHYKVMFNGEEFTTTKDNSCQIKIPTTILMAHKNRNVRIDIIAVHSKNKIVKKSPPCSINYKMPSIKRILNCRIKRSISPKYVKFKLEFKNMSILQDFFYIYLYRSEKGEKEQQISKSILRESITLEDNSVVAGKTYNYLVKIENIEEEVLNEIQEIPQMGITSSLEKIGYETCSWNIHIDKKTLSCMKRNIEIHRLGRQKKIHQITWKENTTSLQFQDSLLVPGEKFEYYLYLFLENGEQHECFLGNVITKKFELEVDVQTSYNCSNISWKPSPRGKIECIEVYDGTSQLLAATKSDSISLENLEPQKDYYFPLKYKYSSGYTEEGNAITFKTKSYHIKAETTDYDVDSFRLKWESLDTSFLVKLKKMLLKVSENIGEHELNPNTRSVQLKQLLPCTTYKWSISGKLRSGKLCLLAEGNATTQIPPLDVNIKAGLINHITWQYKKTPAILKIEVHRDDLPLVETDENELYDSDFKNGKKVTYRFFYVMSDKRKLLATKKTVKSLSMNKLFSAIKIQPAIGTIEWDFRKLKKYTFFNNVELFLNGQSIFLKNNDDEEKLLLQDQGQFVNESLEEIGLPFKAMNFELAVVGLAPIVRKCKKKWVLSVEKVKCYYNDLPYNFKVFREYSRIYFQWEKMATNFLEEITIERLSDQRIIYSGPNQTKSVFDDYKLDAETHNQYVVKLKYKNHQTFKKIDILLDNFDENRLNIKEEIFENSILISWGNNLNTSITSIGWCKILQSLVPKFLKRYHFVNFTDGNLNIPIQSKNMSYELVYKDCYDNIFYGAPRNILDQETIKIEQK